MASARSTTLRLGPDDGTVHVHVYREGMAQRIGHDLVMQVRRWSAAAELAADGVLTAIEFSASPSSLEVVGAHGGARPLTAGDRSEIRRNLETRVLGDDPIRFSSESVERHGDELRVGGALTLAGATRGVSFELAHAAGGSRVSGTVTVAQSEWGIEPYRAFLGALRVRDSVDIVVDLQLPSN